MQTFSGVWPALVTPIADDQTVNTAQLHDIIGYLLGKGVDGFYVGGTTGEGIYLSVTQRRRLAEAALKEIGGRVPVIVHIGSTVAQDAAELARHAAEHGANGISSVLPPLYNTMDSLQRYYETAAAGAPSLPMICYLLNPNIDTVALMRRLASVPNLGGAKYTGPNMYEMRQIIDLGAGKWSVFSGMDEQCIYGAMMGASGAIGSTINFMPGVYKQITQKVKAGDYAGAQALQVRANKVIAAVTSVPYGGALKVVMGKLGVQVGNPVLPNLPLTDEQRRTLDQALAESEFATLAAM